MYICGLCVLFLHVLVLLASNLLMHVLRSPVLLAHVMLAPVLLAHVMLSCLRLLCLRLLCLRLLCLRHPACATLLAPPCLRHPACATLLAPVMLAHVLLAHVTRAPVLLAPTLRAPLCLRLSCACVLVLLAPCCADPASHLAALWLCLNFDLLLGPSTSRSSTFTAGQAARGGEAGQDQEGHRHSRG